MMKEKNREEGPKILFIPNALDDAEGGDRDVDFSCCSPRICCIKCIGKRGGDKTCDTYTSHLRLQPASDMSCLAHV